MRLLAVSLGGGILVFELLMTLLSVRQAGRDCHIKTCQRMLFFTAVDSISTAEGSTRLTQAQAALDSALEHAPSLVPVLIYSGKPTDFIAQHYSQRGAHVVYHDVAFLPDQPEHLRKRRAQYMRLDAAALALELLQDSNKQFHNVSRDVILYADTDTLIEKDISTCSFHQPAVLALGPEGRKHEAFNSGVMLINIRGWLRNYESLLEYARSVNWTFYQGTLQDQGLINEFFTKEQISLELLPNEANWKGYWGWNPNAIILHFHGLKPDLCLRTMVKGGRDCPLYTLVCDHLHYKSMHYKYQRSSPDDKMWAFMYRDYLHHLNQTDDFSSSCVLEEPIPLGVQRPTVNMTAVNEAFVQLKQQQQPKIKEWQQQPDV